MTQIRFLKLSLVLPILLPLVLWQLTTLGVGFAEGSGPLSVIVWLLIVSPLIGGLPYVVFALILLWLLRGRSLEACVRVSWLLPWLFAFFLGIVLLVLALIDDLDDPNVGAAAFAGLAVGYGYFYVVIVQALRRILTQMGVLSRTG